MKLVLEGSVRKRVDRLMREGGYTLRTSRVGSRQYSAYGRYYDIETEN